MARSGSLTKGWVLAFKTAFEVIRGCALEVLDTNGAEIDIAYLNSEVCRFKHFDQNYLYGIQNRDFRMEFQYQTGKMIIDVFLLRQYGDEKVDWGVDGATLEWRSSSAPIQSGLWRPQPKNYKCSHCGFVLEASNFCWTPCRSCGTGTMV